MKSTCVVFHNARIATAIDSGKPISAGFDQILFQPDFAIAAVNGNIVEIGNSARILLRFPKSKKVDCRGRLVTPGFVDCHTHLVFAGNRSNEIGLRLRGLDYMQIHRREGGIHKTVRETRKATESSLVRLAAGRIANMVSRGTTTIEVKSGYGLSAPAELKILRVISALAKSTPARIVPTYMPLHALPPGVSRRKFLADSIDSLQMISNRGLAVFCDAFCEKGFFTVDESRAFLNEARRLGFKLKIHANEFSASGGAKLAAELGAVSADHLDHSSSADLAALRRAGCIAVLIPGVSYFLGREYPDFRRFALAGVPFALSTDFNPGTCPIYSMAFIFSLAVLQMKMTPEAALIAATLNAAYALSLGRTTGSIQPGKSADLIVWNASSLEDIAYSINSAPIASVFISGKQVA